MLPQKRFAPAWTLPAALVALALAACGGSKQPEPAPAPAPPADTAQSETPPDEQVVESEAAAAEDELATREEELAKREAELALKEREAEIARREAELAAREAAAKKPPAKPAATTAQVPPPPPAKSTPPPPPPPPPPPLVIPSGTQFAVQLSSPVTTKTAKVGDTVNATLVSDIMVDGKVAVPAGATVQGSVTQVVSGSNKIGGTPTLGLTFSQLYPNPDTAVAISGNITQAGQSETGKDTAKIAGGALIGGVIGHQIDHDKGRYIGGLLGAAGGAVAAQKTGGEVELPAGTTVGFVLDAPVEVKP